MEEQSSVKQIIVIRKDLKLNRGKEISMGSHGSLMWLSKRLQKHWNNTMKISDLFSEAEKEWLTGRFAKITLQVDNEDKIKELKQACAGAGVEADLVIDSGKTYFHGIPTITALGTAPNYSEKLDPIFKSLRLY